MIYPNMTEEPDYIVEISGQPAHSPDGLVETTQAHISSGKAGGRPYISIYFECCSVYQRIYRNREASAYFGNCPRCLREVNVKIGPGGTGQRFFSAT